MALVESLNGTLLNASVIIDKSGCPWSLVASATSGLQVMIKGTIDLTTSNVSTLLYWNHNIYYESGTQWFKRSSGKWASTTDPRITESPSGTSLNSAGSAITDASNNIWTLATSASGLEVMENGKAAGYSANVTLLLYWQHVIYQMNSTGGWWSWINNAWVNASDPRVTPPTPAPTPTPTGNIVKIDLTANLGPVSPFVWGVGTEGLNAPGINDYGAAANPGWQATYRQQNWRLFRHNTQGSVNFWPGGGNQNTTMQNNWANGLPNFFSAPTSSADTAHNQQMFTIGSANDPSSTSQVVTLANWFKSIGYECHFWEYWNEPDGSDVNTYCQNFNAIQAALKGVNPDYKVGGPTTSYCRGDWLGPLSQQCQPDFISYHCYLTGGYSDNTSLFNLALSRTASDVGMVRQYFNSSIPIFLGEWNIDYNGQEPMMQTIDGAIFGALYTFGAMTAPNANVTMGAIWTIGENANFTIVNDDGSDVRPFGSVLGVLGRKMGGTQASVAIATGMPHLLAMASYSGSNWAVWFTNYDTGTDYTVTVQGLPAANYVYWECSANNPTPISSNNAASTLASLTIPSRSVVVLSSS
jgi:hypothetical protein